MSGGRSTAASPYATTNVMDFVEFASSGNAQDFGDLSFDQAGAGGAHLDLFFDLKTSLKSFILHLFVARYFKQPIIART